MTKVPDDFDGVAPDCAAALVTLTKTSSEFGEIRIMENRIKGSHIYWQEGWQQSEADRNGVSLATYVHAIFGLLTQITAHEMLMIGCGGGTLGTMLARAGQSVTIVDINLPGSTSLYPTKSRTGGDPGTRARPVIVNPSAQNRKQSKAP